ncbi:MAG: hypothetical protein IPM49_12620 [Flavobacteriales bacterium]|nr:hypothetical protein [Flavobacteriales bacterium]
MTGSLRTAMDLYFRGERAEMIAFLVFAGVLVLAAGLLWTTSDRFARSLALVLGLCAVIACSTAIPLLLRDGPHAEKLRVRLAQGEEAGVRADEGARMAVVNRNYATYRYLYAAAMLAAFGLMLFWRNATTSGIAVGLLVFAATGLVVDHYSEERAAVYTAALQAS